MSVNVDRLPWYNFNRILSHNAYYSCVLGSRGTGKTFGAKLKGIKDALYKDKQFIYLRRFKEETSKSKDGFFDDIIQAEKFPNWDFRVAGNKGQAAHKNTRDDKKREWKTICFFHTLSTSGQIKGQSFPYVHLIIFDEFIIEQGFVRYIPHEVQAFNQFYSTVDRYKGQVRVLLLSNSVSIMNPYFLEWDIEPKPHEEWIIRANGFIAVHFDRNSKFEESVYATPFGRFIAGTTYGDYAVGNQFADNHTELVEDKPSTARYKWTLETVYGGSLSLWYDLPSGNWYAQRKRPQVEDIRTLNPDNASPKKTLIFSNDKVLGIVKSAYRHGRMFFDKPQSRNTFRELF